MPTKFSQLELQERARSIITQVTGVHNIKLEPKVILILNRMGCDEHILKTIQAGVTDYWLPIPDDYTMPPGLPPGPSTNFLEVQALFLESTFELNQEHWNLDQQAMFGTSNTSLPKTLTYEDFLGSGGYATVAKAKGPGGALYAVKKTHRKTHYLDAVAQMREIRGEIENLKKIVHHHCVKYVGSYSDIESVGVIMEPVADCNLGVFLASFDGNQKTQSYKTLCRFFGCLASALHYLHHKLKTRHKDIKPTNILVKGENILFTDFGMSHNWGEQGVSTTQEEVRRSPIYCAPEAARDEPRNSQSDVWSLGCVFLEMAAVNHGLSSTYIKGKLMDYGGENFRDSPRGIKYAILELRAHGKRSQNIPLGWVENMLKMTRDERYTPAELRIEISKTIGQPDCDFFGICCVNQGPGLASINHPMIDGVDGQKTSNSAEPNRSTELATLYDDKTGEWPEVELTRRSDIPDNWICRSIVNLYELEMESSGERGILEVGGQLFESDTRVSVTFRNGDRSDERDFWVAQGETRFQLLIRD